MQAIVFEIIGWRELFSRVPDDKGRNVRPVKLVDLENDDYSDCSHPDRSGSIQDIQYSNPCAANDQQLNESFRIVESCMSHWKNLLIDSYRSVTWPLRKFMLLRMKQQVSVPIAVLFYHRVADEHPNPWTISHRDFERQMTWMQDNFDMISLDEVQRRIKTGNSRPAVSVTFDDGYAENCSFALPLLLERRIPVTYFVTTHHTTHGKPFPHDLDRGQPLAPNSIDSLRALVNAGVEIGAHTRTHRNLGQCFDKNVIYDEVVAATLELETMLDFSIRYFAFPFGQPEDLNPVVFELLQENGFSGVCSAYGGINEIGGDGFHLQRIHGDPNFSRMKNWLTMDPRWFKASKYDWQKELEKIPVPVPKSKSLQESGA